MKRKNIKLLSILYTAIISVGLFAGCGSSGSKQVINVLNYGANAAEGVYDEFEKETGIKVNEMTFDDMQFMYQEVSSGKVDYDVILVSDDMAEKMIKEDEQLWDEQLLVFFGKESFILERNGGSGIHFTSCREALGDIGFPYRQLHCNRAI